MKIPMIKPQTAFAPPSSHAGFLRYYQDFYGSADKFIANLPFAAVDASGGTEHELQAMVVGRGDDVDLVRAIRMSNYHANIVKRAASGEISHRDVEELQQFMGEASVQAWENSWVRFRRQLLHPSSEVLLREDLKADKNQSNGPMRADLDRFLYHEGGRDWVRMPISYLLKISLADILATSEDLPDLLRRRGAQLLNNFTNDNSSPETVSFYVCRSRETGRLGRELAIESALRFLLCQVLAGYANRRFELRENGQSVRVCFSPLSGSRLKKLNTLIPDSFYRELFMSPCLSGWRRGEDKHRYMSLCHQTLSRSQLNGIAKLKEAGIITNNLVVLPNTSNISLANNGVHISLGSRKLADWQASSIGLFGPAQEKYFGDLAIKIVEHFLPLFVGTYSAAPYRLNFSDFHPEVALGFLPHELDYTHLRMLWRRWKKKAAIRVAGHPLTPFGPIFIDRLISRIMGLKGDYVPDFRLVDYFVSLLSTDQCPALDGMEGNFGRLKVDLESHGVFDRQMASYLLYRNRHLKEIGFSGFEGRYYSLFESFSEDLAEAADLQVLLTAMAYRLIFSGEIGHGDIPDNPTVESERRQIFFGAALGIPTFYVQRRTGNRFLQKLLASVENARASRRYPGYLRIGNRDYRLALLRYLKVREKGLVELMQAQGLLASLEDRLHPENGLDAESKLISRVVRRNGKNSALKMAAEDFNFQMEEYYRQELRLRQIGEACDCLAKRLRQAEKERGVNPDYLRKSLEIILHRQRLEDFLAQVKADFRDDRENPVVLRKLAALIVFCVTLADGQGRYESERAGDTLLLPTKHWAQS